jgi:hypothetical protein
MISKKDLTKKLYEELGENAEGITFQNFHKSVWINIREKKSGGLRLTESGFEYLESVLGYKSYRVEFPKDSEYIITNQTIINIDRYIDCPYYLDRDAITVFKEKTAVQLVLFSGDIAKFGRSNRMAKDLL